ncbi:MAG: hypothetical protein ABR543_14540 [Gemmatimonadaceae bacterium]
MRIAHLARLLCLPVAIGASSVGAQAAPPAPNPVQQSPISRPPRPAPSPAVRDSLKLWLDSLGRNVTGVNISLEYLTVGGQTVAVGEHLTHGVTAVGGDLEVFGKVNGNAVAIRGNVVVHAGAQILGDAIAIGGEVKADAGTVSGELRSVTGSLAVVAPIPSRISTPAERMRRSLSLTAGFFGILAAIGTAVSLLARDNIATVALTLRLAFWRAFVTGLLGQVLALPALILIVVALAITLIGILVIPFAVVGFALLLTGALAIGFLAVALIAGGSFAVRGDSAGPLGRRQDALSMLVGLALFFALWVAAGLALGYLSAGTGAAVQQIVAVLTWLAVTVGFGATILSRGGARRLEKPVAIPPETDELSWQTPTPVSGVTAARRPTPAPRPREL